MFVIAGNLNSSCPFLIANDLGSTRRPTADFPFLTTNETILLVDSLTPEERHDIELTDQSERETNLSRFSNEFFSAAASPAIQLYARYFALYQNVPIQKPYKDEKRLVGVPSCIGNLLREFYECLLSLPIKTI
ncbi:MAG: hypothetical protein LBR89_01765 [Holosporales bacterium]|nr:hypothetical protein [Holosporales bacterium]